MDTENFLLERRSLVARLQSRRGEISESRAEMSKKFLGLGWGEWGKLLLDLGPQRPAFTWAGRLAMTSAIPIIFGYCRKAVLSRLEKKTPWRRLAGVLSLFKGLT